MLVLIQKGDSKIILDGHLMQTNLPIEVESPNGGAAETPPKPRELAVEVTPKLSEFAMDVAPNPIDWVVFVAPNPKFSELVEAGAPNPNPDD
jgi:hypothetical protein